VSRPVKRSLTLRGHRTSVSLEEPFWAEFQRLAAQDDLSVNELAATLDEGRGEAASLASAIRVWVLKRALASR
jgi:predicted DNA-binding ribbon-helix-helix protein